MQLSRLFAFIVAVLCGLPPVAGAQRLMPVSDVNAPRLRQGLNEIDFGGRVTALEGNGARFQRLRDLRDGPKLNRLRFARRADAWNVRVAVDRAGYRDQRYAASLTRYGSLKVDFTWDQVPLFYASAALTPYRSVSPGELRLDPSLRALVQGRTSTTQVFGGALESFDLRSRRDVASLRLLYSATRQLDLTVSFTSTNRTGTQPYGASFGFNNAVEVAALVASRANDLNAAAE